MARFIGTDILKLGVEGIEFGADANITITVYRQESQGGPYEPNGTDTVRIRVAPFVLCDHTMDVKDTGTQKTVYVLDANWADPDGNSDLTTALGTKFSLVDEVAYDVNNLDRWQQDGYEVGYVKAPYGQMPVFLVSPRAFRDSVKYGDDVLAKYVHNTRLEANVGVCWRLEHLGWLDGHNGFGNVESIPYASGPGDLFYGTGGSGAGYDDPIHQDVIDFFVAQDVNPVCDVNTGWLSVGHVDEAVSFASDGSNVLVADPCVAYGLLYWAYEVNGNKAMHNSMRPDLDDLNDDERTDPSSGRTVYQILGNTTLYLGEYNLNGTWATVDLPGIRDELGLESPETITKATCGDGATKRILHGVTVFVGFFPDTEIRYYKIEFFQDAQDGLHYHLYWSYNSSENWDPNSPTREESQDIGKVGDSNDYLFKDALCQILYDRWEGTGYVQAGDHFLFEADPDCGTIEVPVLFFEYDDGTNYKASAYTVDHVNCLVNGNTVFTGEPHGPHVLNNQQDSNPADDILRSYVVSLFGNVYNDVQVVPSRFYHNGQGDIHCGTNVRREIPSSYDWWECN